MIVLQKKRRLVVRVHLEAYSNGFMEQPNVTVVGGANVELTVRYSY